MLALLIRAGKDKLRCMFSNTNKKSTSYSKGDYNYLSWYEPHENNMEIVQKFNYIPAERWELPTDYWKETFFETDGYNTGVPETTARPYKPQAKNATEILFVVGILGTFIVLWDGARAVKLF